MEADFRIGFFFIGNFIIFPASHGLKSPLTFEDYIVLKK